MIDLSKLKGRTVTLVKSTDAEFYKEFTLLLDELRDAKGDGCKAVIDGAIWSKCLQDINIVRDIVLPTNKVDVKAGLVGTYRGVKILCTSFVSPKVRREELGDEDIQPFEVVTMDYNR